jgi:peptidoglycan/LPS O-acetylase OafA/YrhL
MRSPSRLIQLDVLRFLAVVLVLGRHMSPFEEALPEPLRKFSFHWIQCGWAGVDLFFVLSGFLISGLLFREYQSYGQIRIFRFLVRRGFKIYPSFLLFLAGVLYVQITNYNWNPEVTPYQLIRELLFLQSYAPGLLAHTWSLGVEEHFYILLPLVMLFACRRFGDRPDPFWWLPKASLAIFVILLAARLTTAWCVPGLIYYTHWFPTHLRIDSLLFGVLISYYYHYYHASFVSNVRRYAWVLGAIGLLLLVVSFINLGTFFIYTSGFTCLFTAFGIFLAISLVFPMPQREPVHLLLRGAAFVGAHSYTIYLWHMPVKIWGPMYAQRWFGLKPSGASDLLIYFVGSILLGVVLSLMLEVPMLKLRDWLFPSRSQPLVQEEQEINSSPSST